jgi:uncharacterized protein with PQ loop repeat
MKTIIAVLLTINIALSIYLIFGILVEKGVIK